MDKLKQYLLEHRDAMDVEIPPADLLPHIQAGAVAAATKAVLIKYIIGICISAVIGTGAWMIIHNQKASHTPPSVTPSKKVIQKDTVPVQKDTMPVSPVQPVIKHKKIRKAPPAPPVIIKHKKSPDTVVHPTYPRKKKNPVPVYHPTKPRPKKDPLPVDHPTPPRKKKKGDVPIT